MEIPKYVNTLYNDLPDAVCFLNKSSYVTLKHALFRTSCHEGDPSKDNANIHLLWPFLIQNFAELGKAPRSQTQFKPFYLQVPVYLWYPLPDAQETLNNPPYSKQG